MKVMTFNLRMRTEKDGINCFDNRKEKIVSVIRRENPDLIGFQEATDPMFDFLAEELKEYVFLGHGRNADYCGEGTPIAYRKDRFYLHSFREEWLSTTPDLPGSRLHGLGQSNCPRVLISAQLYDRKGARLIAFFNIHMDYERKPVQATECALLAERVAAINLPYIITGDFNMYPDAGELAMLTDPGTLPGAVDATGTITGSFHNFGRFRENPKKIDYIFTNLPVNPEASYAVPDDDACGYFYSDHYALCAFPDSENDKTEKESD